MKVVGLPAGNDASGFYRIKLPITVLAAQGYDCEWYDPKTPGLGKKLAEEADVLVIQRPLAPDSVKMIESAHSYGIAVVVDFDDNFDALARNHSMYWQVTDEMKAACHACCEMADLVTVTTRKLFQVYGRGAVLQLPNYVDESLLDVRRNSEHEGTWVGWTGTVSTHPNDLQVMGNGLKRALADNPGSQFVHVGNREGRAVQQATGIRDLMSTGGLTFDDYFKAFADFDVAVVPLDDTTFNASKSWLKSIEASTLGVPVVMSPTDANRELWKMRIGALAKDPADWCRQVGWLLCDQDLREERGAAAREVVREHLTIQQHADRFWSAWAMARAGRRALSSASS